MVSFRLAVVLIIRIHLKNRSTGFHSRCSFWFHYVWDRSLCSVHGVLSARKLTWMATSFTPNTTRHLHSSFQIPTLFLSFFVWKCNFLLYLDSRLEPTSVSKRRRELNLGFLWLGFWCSVELSARPGVLYNNLSPTDTLALGSSSYTFGWPASQSHLFTFQWSPCHPGQTCACYSMNGLIFLFFLNQSHPLSLPHCDACFRAIFIFGHGNYTRSSFSFNILNHHYTLTILKSCLSPFLLAPSMAMTYLLVSYVFVLYVTMCFASRMCERGYRSGMESNARGVGRPLGVADVRTIDRMIRRGTPASVETKRRYMERNDR